MPHYVHDYCGVIVFDPCQLVTLVFPCKQRASMCLMLWWAPVCLSMNILTHAVYTSTKPCRCAIAHQTWNSAKFSPRKWGILLPYFHSESLVRIVFCVLWHIYPKMYRIPTTKINSHHENKAKCSLFVVLSLFSRYYFYSPISPWSHALLSFTLLFILF